MVAAGLGDWPGRNCTVITGVNNRGDMVGIASNEEIRDQLPSKLPAGGRLDDGTAINLTEALGQAGIVWPVEIDDSGQVLCNWGLNNRRSVVLLTPTAGGKWSSKLLTQEGKEFEVVGVNDRGWVIGTIRDGRGKSRPFAWTGDALVELNRCIPAGSGFKDLGEPVRH